MPGIFVVVPMVIAIVEAFTRPAYHAPQDEADQSEQKSASRNAFGICHVGPMQLIRAAS